MALVLAATLPVEGQDGGGWTFRATGYAGLQAGSTPRRTLDLPGSSERRVWGLIGLELDAAMGPFRLQFAPRWEDRLLDDPDWPRRARGDDQGLALRTPVARLTGRWRWFAFEVGEVERNWGPSGVPGLLVSPLGYHRRGAGFAVGPEVLRFQWRTERLSTEPTAAGDVASRWFTVHRLRWRPSQRWEIAGWEAMVTAETDGIDPARLNPFAFYTFGKQFGIEDRRNTSVGLDLAFRPGDRTWLEAQLLLDDLVIWDADENPFPNRFGFTVQARRTTDAGPGWRAWATGLSGIALNTFRPEEAFVDIGAGLGRLRPDHLAAGVEVSLSLGRGLPGDDLGGPGIIRDTWTAAVPADGWRIAAAPSAAPAGGGALGGLPGAGRVEVGLRWRRQGEGRFTDPFPDPPANAPDLPTFSPAVERETLAVHLGLDWTLGPFVLNGASQLQYRRFPASGRESGWGTEARVQLVWRVGRWIFEGT